MKLSDILFTIGSSIVIFGTECVAIGVMITNGAFVWELIVAGILMFGIDLMIPAFFTLE